MADFAKALSRIFDNEGGLANNKYDKGGITKFGISLKFLKDCGIDKSDLDKDGIRYERIGDMDGDGDVDKDDIILLTKPYAALLYRYYFWDSIQLDKVAPQAIAEQVFDISVNSGPVKSVKLLQRALLRISVPISVDGIIGNDTLCKTNNVNVRELNNALVAVRKGFYHNIVADDPTQKINLQGWLNRAEKFRI